MNRILIGQYVMVLSVALYVFSGIADEEEWSKMPYFDGLYENGLVKGTRSVYPARYCLSDENVSLSPTHSMQQGHYGTCWACAMMHALEIEVKKILLRPGEEGVYGLPFSTFNINLSERQFLECYKYFYWNGTRGRYWDLSGDPPELSGDLHHFAANRLARNGWIIPLEGDNCYSSSGGSHVGENVYIDTGEEPFEQTKPFDVGIQLLDQYGYAAARVSSAWNEGTELAVKHTIINNHAVMVAIRVHEHPGWNYVDWQSTGDDVDHAVCIIGWDDNAVVVDYVQGQGWVQRNLGKAWIVKNSHGITHRQPDGTYTNWFYMKIEGDIADEKYFYCIVAPIKIYGEVSFINRLYAANNLDCNNDELSHTNWCGQNISTPTPKGFSYGGGRVVGVTEGMNASLSGFVSTDGEKIAPGEYRVKRYEVNISFRYFGTGLKPYFNYTHGASGNVNIIYPWCDLISINEQKNMLSNATMRTFVYYVDYKVNGQTPIDCYYPCSPEKARVGVIYTPIESVACPNPFAPVSIDNKNSILNGNMFKENKRRQ